MGVSAGSSYNHRSDRFECISVYPDPDFKFFHHPSIWILRDQRYWKLCKNVFQSGVLESNLEFHLFLHFNSAGRDFSGTGNSSAAECEDCRKNCVPRHLFSADGSCTGGSGYGLEMDF